MFWVFFKVNSGVFLHDRVAILIMSVVVFQFVGTAHLSEEGCTICNNSVS